MPGVHVKFKLGNAPFALAEFKGTVEPKSTSAAPDGSEAYTVKGVFYYNHWALASYPAPSLWIKFKLAHRGLTGNWNYIEGNVSGREIVNPTTLYEPSSYLVPLQTGVDGEGKRAPDVAVEFKLGVVGSPTGGKEQYGATQSVLGKHVKPALGPETASGIWGNPYAMFPFAIGGRQFCYGSTDAVSSDYLNKKTTLSYRWFTQELLPGGLCAQGESDRDQGKKTGPLGTQFDVYSAKFPFSSGGQRFFFAHDPDSKRWFIRELLHNGKIGAETEKGQWRNGYSMLFPFWVGGKQYFFGHSQITYSFFIHELLPGGKMGPKDTVTGNMKKAYDVLFPFQVGKNVYFYAHDVKSKGWLIQELLPGGTIGKQTSSGTWGQSYEVQFPIRLPFDMDDDQYFYGHDVDSKRWFIQKLLPGGKMGSGEAASGTWDQPYSVQFPFELDGRQYIFSHSPKTSRRWCIRELVDANKPKGTSGKPSTTGSAAYELPLAYKVPAAFRRIDLTASAATVTNELIKQLEALKPPPSKEQIARAALTQLCVYEMLAGAGSVYAGVLLMRTADQHLTSLTLTVTARPSELANRQTAPRLARTMAAICPKAEVGIVRVPCGPVVMLTEDSQVGKPENLLTDGGKPTRVRQLHVFVPVAGSRVMADFCIATENLEAWGDAVDTLSEVCRTIRFTS
ncbi:hypothetical protein [Streptomyces lavendulae]|uniref:hypothetical protein n=1 Tax=Streptomyces lavendulae TaxID=1914 RepID=UPI0031EFFE0B